MKRLVAIMLVLCMVFCFAACGEQKQAEEKKGGDPEKALTLVSKAFIDPLTEWKQYDELIAKIKSETDYAKRTQMMHDAEDILMSNYCVIPLYYYNDIYLQKPYVSGIYSNAFATKFFMYAKMDNGADTLKINLASEPDYLDPALNSSVDGACLAANSFSGLYTYNAEGKCVPACADSYTTNADGTVYTVKLKEGLKWSNGEKLDANDFVYSWQRAALLSTAADYGYMFSGFDGYSDSEDSLINVKALDANTLEFTLTAPCAYMEDLMAFPTFYPVHQKSVEAADKDGSNPGAWCQEAGFVCNGPFVCKSWEHDVSMTYEKNPNWYDAANVNLKGLQFMLSADDTAIYAAYNDGSIDFADSVPTDEVQNLLKNPEFYIVDELGTYYAAFNCKSKLFADKTPAQAACMREAFSLLIDREFICENVGQTGQVAANAYIPLGMADGNGGVFKYDSELVGYYDPYAINDHKDETIAKAIELLEVAGYEFKDGKLSDATPITIEYLTNDGTGHVAVAESMQQDFAQIGITLTIQKQDWNVFLEERKNGNFDFAREGWIADFNDPINMLEMWITNSGNNDCQYGR